MIRQIYEVDATIIDANGSFNHLNGYPKRFDSKSYSGDLDKTERRAEAEFSDTWGAMCKRDDRQMQTVIMLQANGKIMMRKSMGNIPPEPDPEPEPEEVVEE